MNDITPYSQANDELKVQMEALMQPLEENPSDIKTISSYGVTDIVEMSQLAKDILTCQTAFNSAVTAGIDEETLNRLERQADALLARATTLRDKMAVFIGSAEEITRRYDEVYIPEVQQMYDQTKDAEVAEMLSDIKNGKQVFTLQALLLESCHAGASDSVVHCTSMKDVIAKKMKNSK